MTIVIFVLMSICAAAFLYFGVPLICGRAARVLLEQKAKKFNALVLTFDDGLSFHDGPGVKLTTAILDLLAEQGVKATFFLLGKHIPGREAIVRRIKAEGHDIGAHGYGHLNYWKVSPFRALMDIKQGWHAIEIALGKSRGIYPFRPPYGKLNLICFLYLWIRRVSIVYWTLDLGDTKPDSDHNSRRIAALIRESTGAVVLAHDFDRANKSVNEMVLESVRAALLCAKDNKMRVLTISQLLKSRNR
jgi:peptidoglycan/xylan/chitin deacetylase (PgdA/CDA1 family)